MKYLVISLILLAQDATPRRQFNPWDDPMLQPTRRQQLIQRWQENLRHDVDPSKADTKKAPQ